MLFAEVSLSKTFFKQKFKNNSNISDGNVPRSQLRSAPYGSAVVVGPVLSVDQTPWCSVAVRAPRFVVAVDDGFGAWAAAPGIFRS